MPTIESKNLVAVMIVSNPGLEPLCFFKERELDDLKRRFGAAEREKELLQNSSSAGQSELMSKIASLEARGEEQTRKKEGLLGRIV